MEAQPLGELPSGYHARLRCPGRGHSAGGHQCPQQAVLWGREPRAEVGVSSPCCLPSREGSRSLRAPDSPVAALCLPRNLPSETQLSSPDSRTFYSRGHGDRGPAWRGLTPACHCLFPPGGTWRPGPKGAPAVPQMPSDTWAPCSPGKASAADTGPSSGLQTLRHERGPRPPRRRGCRSTRVAEGRWPQSRSHSHWELRVLFTVFKCKK